MLRRRKTWRKCQCYSREGWLHQRLGSEVQGCWTARWKQNRKRAPQHSPRPALANYTWVIYGYLQRECHSSIFSPGSIPRTSRRWKQERQSRAIRSLPHEALGVSLEPRSWGGRIVWARQVLYTSWSRLVRCLNRTISASTSLHQDVRLSIPFNRSLGNNLLADSAIQNL